jgi:hypothetical protein
VPERFAATLDGDLLTVDEVFRMGGREWPHRFTNRRVEDDVLREMLVEVGLHLDRFLAPTWLVARPASTARPLP